MGFRILVAEDDRDIRALIAISLRMAGHQIEQAEDGESALDLARANPPDLIIVDVMMPGIDGYEVTRRLAGDSRTASVPILMLSARGQARDIDEGLASGAHAYVVKPFSPRELVARVNEMLGEARDRPPPGDD